MHAGLGPRPAALIITHLFALLHFIDQAQMQAEPFHACFVDVQSAYDTVQHDLLWGRLASFGVQLSAQLVLLGCSMWMSGRAALSAPRFKAFSLMACISI